MDQKHYEDTLCVFDQPDYLCIGYFYSVSGEILAPCRRLVPGAIQSYMSRKSEYRMILHKGIPVESVSVTMTPEYYWPHLRKKCGDAHEDPETSVHLVDGQRDFPELVSVFKQIRGYRGDGMSAKIFYEWIWRSETGG